MRTLDTLGDFRDLASKIRGLQLTRTASFTRLADAGISLRNAVKFGPAQIPALDQVPRQRIGALFLVAMLVCVRVRSVCTLSLLPSRFCSSQPRCLLRPRVCLPSGTSAVVVVGQFQLRVERASLARSRSSGFFVGFCYKVIATGFRNAVL
jgi:hypothetical protein